MHTDLILSNFIIENNRFIFNNKVLDIKSSMFMCYYRLQASITSHIKEILLETENSSLQNGSYSDRVLWLWALGEYIHKAPDDQVLSQIDVSISTIVKEISDNWVMPMKSWIAEDLSEDIYLANLSLAYGALLSINHSLKNEEIMVLMQNIKQYMFKKLMKGSHVISRISDREVLGDISLSAVPFAMVDAGNQILVEAITEVENRLITKGVRLSAGDSYYGGCVRNVLTLLLAWYYSEKGDMSKAKGLLNDTQAVYMRNGSLQELVSESSKELVLYDFWVKKQGELPDESPLAYILYAIAQQNIDLKGKPSESGFGTNVIHTGGGNGNPYLFELTERHPRFPIEGELVTLRAVTQPFSETQQLSVIYCIDGAELDRKSMRAVRSKSAGRFWEVELGSFSAHKKLNYRFELTAGEDSELVITSEIYEVLIKKWLSFNKIIAYAQNSEGIVLYFEKADSVDGIPAFRLIAQNNKIKFKYCIEKAYPGNELKKVEQLNIGHYLVDISPSGGMKIRAVNGIVIMESHGNESFMQLLTDGSGVVQRVKINLKMTAEEKLFGTGERYSHLDLRGQKVENYVYNQYRDQALKTYIPTPFILSSKGYALYLDTAFPATFDFSTRLSDLMSLDIQMNENLQELNFYIFSGAPKEILAAYSEVIGRPVLPPKWTFGPWISSNNWDCQKEVARQLELNKKYEIPSTVIVLEQWSDEATFYIFNDAQYEVKDANTYLEYSDYRFPEWGRWPDPKKLVEDIHSDGLKVLLWQAPVMKYMDGIAHVQRDEDERVMLENNYHISCKSGKPYRVPYHEWFKRSLIPDFTNPQAVQWWLNKRLYLLKDINIDGFKTDGGECIYGDDLVFHDGTPASAMRNLYPNTYIKSFYNFVKQQKNGDGITFSRAGYTGAHKIPLHWAGDERSTFKAFEASIKAGLSSSISGLPFWGWDIAGFNGDIPTAELYIRATQMAVFCPIMQYHAETKGEYNQDRTPWNIAERTGDERVICIYKRYADLRMNLLPYIYNQSIITCETGIPLMRAMLLEYPEDSCCVDMFKQYMFGENLLVAPVIEEGSTLKEVYFPEGKWMSFFDSSIYKGRCFVAINAQLDHIPVFIKENSVIPMNLADELGLCSHVSNTVTEYKNLCFIIFVTESLTFKFKDDIGNEIIIVAQRKENEVAISIEFIDRIMPISLIIRDTVETTEITVNGAGPDSRTNRDSSTIIELK